MITHLLRHAILSPPLQVHLLILLLTSWALPLAHDIPRGMHMHLDNVCNCGDIRNGEQLIQGAKMVMSGSVTITSFILRVKLKGANLQAPCADIVSLFLSRRGASFALYLHGCRCVTFFWVTSVFPASESAVPH